MGTNALKRPPNSYILFANEMREKVSNKEGVRAQIAAKWKEMSPEQKKPYVEKANRMMEAYKRDKRAKNAPKRPPSGYILFANEKRESIKQGNNHAKGLVSSILADEWKKLSEHDKKPYLDKAKKDLDAWKAQNKEFYSADRWWETGDQGGMAMPIAPAPAVTVAVAPPVTATVAPPLPGGMKHRMAEAQVPQIAKKPRM